MKKAPTQLLGGKVTSAVVKPEETTKTVTKMMKVVMVTRTPSGRIANIELALQRGTVLIEIDEPTARALAKVFD